MRWDRRRQGEDGTAIVEFALVLPVFALMFFGMVQFGIAFTGWDQLGTRLQAVARGLASGALCPGGAAACQLSICDQLMLPDPPLGDVGPLSVTYTYQPGSVDGSGEVAINASYPVDVVYGLIPQITLQSSAAAYASPGVVVPSNPKFSCRDQS